MRHPASIFFAFTLIAAIGCDQKQKDAGAAKPDLEHLVGPARTLEQTFLRVHAQLPKLQPAPCSDLGIRSAIARSQSRSVPFIDAAALAFTARGDSIDPNLPFGPFVSKVLLKRRPTRAVGDSKTATDAAFDATKLIKEHDFMAAIEYEFRAPKADAKGFHGGELKGILGLFELRSGKLMCAAPVVAQSHEEVAAKPGQTPQQAADKDLELEARRALEEAFAGKTRELNLDLG
jgi:hypothetical protein